MRRRVVGTVLAAALLASTAAPTFAHIHVTVPAGDCAEADVAASNPTARAALIAAGVPLPAGNVPDGADETAPEHCAKAQP